MMNRVLLLMLLLTGAGCGKPDSDQLLRRYLVDDIGLNKEQLPSAIFVITEDGCPTCDRAFANLVRPRTSTSRCLFLVRAEGRSVDLNGFLNETENVRFDNGTFKDLGILKASGLILLDNDRVDTVIALQASEISKQLFYITSLLDSLGH